MHNFAHVKTLLCSPEWGFQGRTLQTVRNIACVNGTVHYHPATEPADHWFEHEIGCPLELVAHGHVPHRVLSEH